METVTSTSSTQTSIASSPTQTAQETTEDQYNTFLRLLTAQVQNQDPLSPLDSTQFVEQLATFSSLEQQVRTNELLESMSLLIAQNNTASTAQTSIVAFSGDPISFEVTLPEDASRAVVEIKNPSGDIVYSTAITDDTSLIWDGTLTSGDTVSQGLYAISANYYKDGTLLSSGPVTLNQ